ncbi:hypothetical protein IM543_11450 [Massilia sp. UMI-21]|nr:hypothetical protein IM543_11450 [Massilia sp. UMI-21]
MPNQCTAPYRHLARMAATVLLVVPALVGCATGRGPSSAAPDLAGWAEPCAEQRSKIRLERLDKHAMQAAMADGISTGLAISSGALELNPLIATSPAGLIALTGAKIGLVKLADKLPEDEKRLVIKTSGALWSGAAVNNPAVLLSASPPVAIAAGVVAGVLWWRHSTRVYEGADREIAARSEAPPANPHRGTVAVVAAAH